MRKRPIRRAQLIAPFGTGAMMVTPDGVSVIAAGLDHWYTRPSEQYPFDPEEFQFHEWRLERDLSADYFCLPPDYRDPRQVQWGGNATKNLGIQVPFLRFPRWHLCRRKECSRLYEWPLELNDPPRCPYCALAGDKKPPVMTQVRFIAMCPNGHIQDFPWREWVHRAAYPTCDQPMKLYTTGGAGLSATWVKCECGASRSLENITGDASGSESEIGENGSARIRMTHLSKELADDGAPYLCAGHRPWLGEDTGQGCGQPLRGSLRGATNVYYAQVRSALYLPRGDDETPSRLMDTIEQPPISGTLSLLAKLNQVPDVALLRAQHAALLAPYTDQQIEGALPKVSGAAPESEARIPGEDRETAFRRAEFTVLRVARREDQLITNPVAIQDYHHPIRDHFAGVTLVEKIRETRALTGFTRVLSENNQSLDERKAMLWRSPPTGANRWLPAYQVFGEGIYLELDEARLRAWEGQPAVRERLERLGENFTKSRHARGLEEREGPTPRFVLIHTLAHLLMNQMIFECGYSSASLRERLYVSDHHDAPMAGLLIYTAAGDAEGTMGGLVRMGKPGRLEPVMLRAIENARWCSSDPVCMELGKAGQGPDSCNLAACHNCALVPETSCEQFNRFLDRWLVVGSAEDPSPGFFATELL